jgi:hypothetical protein
MTPLGLSADEEFAGLPRSQSTPSDRRVPLRTRRTCNLDGEPAATIVTVPLERVIRRMA